MQLCELFLAPIDLDYLTVLYQMALDVHINVRVKLWVPVRHLQAEQPVHDFCNTDIPNARPPLHHLPEGHVRAS